MPLPSKKVLDLFDKRPHAGRLTEQDVMRYRYNSIGSTNIVELFLNIDSQCVNSVSYLATGGPYLFAALEKICTMIEGQNVHHCHLLPPKQLIEELELPVDRHHDVYEAIQSFKLSFHQLGVCV